MLIKMKTIKIPYYLQPLYNKTVQRVSDINYEVIKADAAKDQVSLGEAWHRRYGRLILQKKEVHKRQGEINVLVKEEKEPKQEQIPTEGLRGSTDKLSKASKAVVKKQKEAGWYYSKERQGLIKMKHIPTHDDKGVLLPHLQALRERER